MLHPASETGAAGGETELMAERGRSFAADAPDVPAMRAGDDQVPIKAAAVGAQYERAVVLDGFQERAELLVRAVLVLPHPGLRQREGLGRLASRSAVAPVAGEVPRLVNP